MKRYSVQVIAEGTPEQNFRITDNVGDNRVGTCYNDEHAQLICDALNKSVQAFKVNPHEPAYPHGAWGQQSGTGMDIRTKIASQMMASLLGVTCNDYELAARNSIEATDALIRELNK